MMLDLRVAVEAKRVMEAADARKSFVAYCKYVHGFDLCEHLLVWHTELHRADISKTLIVAPPETYKSTLLRYETEWLIGVNPDTCTLLIMNTATQAMKQVMAIAETIQGNPKYREVFPEILPDSARGWSKDTLFVTRPNKERPDPTLYGTGIDGPYQGLHVERLIIDDPTDQQDVRSETTMSQQRERLQGVLSQVGDDHESAEGEVAGGADRPSEGRGEDMGNTHPLGRGRPDGHHEEDGVSGSGAAYRGALRVGTTSMPDLLSRYSAGRYQDGEDRRPGGGNLWRPLDTDLPVRPDGFRGVDDTEGVVEILRGDT